MPNILAGNVSSSCPPGCAPLNDGDTAFMIMASTFVMLQTPALGLAQAGIIRRKNALSMLMQTLTGFSIGSLLWFFIGFTLTFGPTAGGKGFIGDLSHMLLIDVGIDCCFPLSTALTIPGVLFATFQLMFATMVPVIVTGAWAERMEFKAFVAFTCLWPFLVYYPLAHWVWNANGWLAEFGVLDFAGGLTIHTSTGVAALVVSYVLAGRMKESGSAPGHHNLPLFILGGSLIWGGWYSFNGGSAYSANGQAAVAVLNTHLSASAGAFTWMLLYRYANTNNVDHHWSLTEIMNGAFAGLAAITPGSGFVMPYSSVCIGILGSVCAYFWVSKVKPWLGVDDALDVAALQGVPGIVGSILVGFAAEYAISPKLGADGLGLFVGGNGVLLWKQLVAVVITVGWTAIFTWLLMRFMRRFVGIDVSPQAEEKGLDYVQIGEQAYDETLAPILDLGADVLTTKLIDAAKAGNLARVKALVQVGAQTEASDYDGRSAMHLAAASGHVEILKYLKAQHGVDISIVDRYGNTPLHDAIANNQTECVSWLKSNGARAIGHTGYIKDRDILQAAAEGNLEEVRWRLQQAKKTENDFEDKPRSSVVNMQDYDHRTPLHVAASEGHREIVRELLRAGADPTLIDRWGMTPLAGALQMRKHKTAEELQSWQVRLHSADVELLVHNVDSPNDTVSTPLLSKSLATQDGLPESLKSVGFQSSSEMSVDARALITAAERGDKSEIVKLLAKGADVNQQDYDGRSSLHLACASNHIEVVQVRHATKPRILPILSIVPFVQNILHEIVLFFVGLEFFYNASDLFYIFLNLCPQL